MPGDHDSQVQVRRAAPGDAALIEALYRELVPWDRNVHVDPKRLAQLQNGHNHLLVLEINGTVCGSAFLTICLDPMYGFHPYGVVENVIVSASVRGHGGGRALMSAIEGEARAAGCTKLMLLSAATRLDAHQFFLKLGFDGEKKRAFIKYLNR